MSGDGTSTGSLTFDGCTGNSDKFEVGLFQPWIDIQFQKILESNPKLIMAKVQSHKT